MTNRDYRQLFRKGEDALNAHGANQQSLTRGRLLQDLASGQPNDGLGDLDLPLAPDAAFEASDLVLESQRINQILGERLLVIDAPEADPS